MSYLQIGPRRPLPDPIPDRLLKPLLAIDPWMHHGSSSRACAVTMSDGTDKLRVSITVVDEFDDAWAAGFMDMATRDAVPVADISGIAPSPHALPADLATKAMHGEEWRMGAYRYAVVSKSGEVFTLVDSAAVWLPDSLTAAEIADVIPNPSDKHQPGGQIPKPEFCYVATPQTHDTDREAYELHFRETVPSEITPVAGAGLREARDYAEKFRLRDRPFAYAAMWDRLTTGVSRYERFMGDDIDLLALFAQREGHSNVPKNHIELGRHLEVTGIAMAAATGRLSDHDLQRLQAIPGWEAAAADAASRVIGFDLLRRRAQEPND